VPKRIPEEDKALIRQLFKEYLLIRAERLEVDRQLLELMEKRAVLMEREKDINIRGLARKFEISQPAVNVIIRPRGLWAI
jgi:hypothetical protein